MANVLINRLSVVAGATPTPAQLAPGEQAVNAADGMSYVELNSGFVVPQNTWQVIKITGGGALLPYRIYTPTDSGVYTLPASATLPVGAWVMVEKLDKYTAQAPVPTRSGGDTLEGSGGVVNSVTMAGITAIRFINAGAGTWEY